MSTVVIDTHGAQLPERYEIRQLSIESEPIIRALVIYGFQNDSELWTPLSRGCLTRKTLTGYRNGCDMWKHCIEFGFIYAVWDKEYEFKRTESASQCGGSGAVYWHEFDDQCEDPEIENGGLQRLQDAIDSPICSVACSYDDITPLTNAIKMQFVKIFPSTPGLFQGMDSNLEPKPTEPNQVLKRSTTVTRPNYGGQGLAKTLAVFLMREAHGRGYTSIRLHHASMAMRKVWMNPVDPWQSRMLWTADPRVKVWEHGDGTTSQPWKDATLSELGAIECFIS